MRGIMDPMTWGFLGTIIGAGTSIATTFINSSNSFRILIKTKEQAQKELKKSFQRETLIELQNELRTYILSCSRAYRSHIKLYNETGLWEELISENLDEDIFNLSSKLSILIQRISNERLRFNMIKLQTSATQCNKARDSREATEHHKNYLEFYEKIHEELGEELRSLY